MSKKKHDEEHTEQDERELTEHDRIEPPIRLEHGGPFHGLPEPDDELRKEFREQDRVREQQQVEAQKPVNLQAGVTPSGDAFPFSASINEPQTVSLPIPENIEVPKPSISSLNPTEAETGGDDFTLYVTGENFFKDSVISFAGQNEPTTLEEDGTLSTVVKPSLWTEPVVVPCVIKNGPELSDAVDFAFNAPVSRSKKKKDDY